MGNYVMPEVAARELLTALRTRGVCVCVGGGWGVDALVGNQTRQHSDLDLWANAIDTEMLFTAFVDQGIDRVHPWPGDRPWNFVLHDGHSRRVDLHMYERLDGHRLHYGSVASPFTLYDRDLSGRGRIAGIPVLCEAPEFALANHSGYELRDSDLHDIAVLRERFGLTPPASQQ